VNILVTGATGFIGRHVVPVLLQRGHQVTALARDEKKAKSMPWWHEVSFIACDLHIEANFAKVSVIPDILIHLAWPGLPNYKAISHFEKNLPADYRFIKALVAAGVKHVLISGTCFEYGMQSGCLSEDTITVPSNPYGLAKDTLRKFVEALQQKMPFILQWIRLFYLYGPGQNPESLPAQIARAIENRESEFKMSSGEQLRDYLSVEEVARRIGLLVDHPECNGIINCCSAKPISIRRFVEQRLEEMGVHMKLKLGYYPYPDYEPMAFWGDGQKLDVLLGP
jgi:dTDP-6-deoxy-L-talose 4-dehydrogenase (NAD+)